MWQNRYTQAGFIQSVDLLKMWRANYMTEMYLNQHWHTHWMSVRIVCLLFPDGERLLVMEADEIGDVSFSLYARSIVPYSEPGENGYSVWFDVLMHDGRKVRYNSNHVQGVEYEEVHLQIGEMDAERE